MPPLVGDRRCEFVAQRNGVDMGVSVDERLRLMLVTDGRGDADRLEVLVQAAVSGGLRAVQLRELQMTASDLARLCDRLRPLLEAVDGCLLVNDRVDVAAAGHAHGAHVGFRSLAPGAARSVLGPRGFLGMSVHDAAEMSEAVAGGCNYAVLAPVWSTATKPDAVGLGLAVAGGLTAAADLPVLWLGGLDAQRARSVGDLPPEQRPMGVAVCSAICAASDPRQATEALLSSCAWAAPAAT